MQYYSSALLVCNGSIYVAGFFALTLACGKWPSECRPVDAKLKIVEQVEAHLLQNVGNIHHDPVVDDLVVLVEAVPVGNAHFDLATGRR